MFLHVHRESRERTLHRRPCNLLSVRIICDVCYGTSVCVCAIEIERGIKIESQREKRERGIGRERERERGSGWENWAAKGPPDEKSQ